MRGNLLNLLSNFFNQSADFMISNKEIKHLAYLGRLELTADEEKMLQKQLPEIIDFVGQFSGLPSLEVEAGRQIMGLESVFREDKEHGLVEERGQDLIKQAPEKKDSFVVVPKVIDLSKE